MDVLECACYSNEHIILLDANKEDKEIYLSIHLARLPWYERIIHAIKYIFGYGCKYGNFEEIIITEKNAKKIKEYIENVIEN